MMALISTQASSAHDLTVAGNASAGGGRYRKVKITGEASIDGDIQCESFRCIGTVQCSGSIRTEAFKITGTAAVSGTINAGSANIQGHIECTGDASMKELHIGGQLDVRGGSLSLEKAGVKGRLIVSGDCQAESLSLKGAFDIGGLLNAGTIDLRLYGESRGREIGGERILVRKGFRLDFLQSLFSIPASGRLIADIIEGDDIDLEYTSARIVRGKNVTIGPGCDIGLVECSGTYTQVKTAKVERRGPIE